MKQTILVMVTEEDIRLGQGRDNDIKRDFRSLSCPVARAMSRVLKQKVGVGSEVALLHEKNCMAIDLPSIASAAIHNFDDDMGHQEPFSFEVQVPKEVLR